MKYLAIIDLGSNSTRFVIEKLYLDGTFKEVERLKKNTRLAEGMFENNGYLTQKAMQRVFEAIDDFQKIAKNYLDLDVICIATAAVREAKNQKKFIEKLSEKFNFKVRILTGNEEAYYDYLGVMFAFDKINNAWLLDTGGASIELVEIKKKKAVNFISLPFGAVNLAEKFNLNCLDLIESKNLFNAEKYIDQKYETIPWLNYNQQNVVLLGGANRALARLDIVREDFHGYRMPIDRVQLLFEYLCNVNYQKRSTILGSEANRADIIISGLLPLMRLLNITGTNEVVFSSSGVREGVLQEYLLNKTN